MKTTISLPDPIFEEAEALAQKLGMSRSELYTKALKAYLRRFNEVRESLAVARRSISNRERILAKLNEVYSQESSELDPVMAKMQFMSLPHQDW